MAEDILRIVNSKFIDPYILRDNSVSSVDNQCHWSESYSYGRQFLVMWAWIYIGSILIYLTFGIMTYYLYFQRKDEQLIGKMNNPEGNRAFWKFDKAQIQCEITTSCWSLFIMSALVAPLEILHLCGYGKLYFHVADYGWLYLLFSPLLFLAFTDSLIYWIHRGLHHPKIYWMHKLHHKFKQSTPFSAFCFHPLDGFAQGLPYHLALFFFPMHSYLYALSLLLVGMWTVNIHDRVTFHIWVVNGAAHHTIHHTMFNYNYGQYFTFWDKLMGTHKDPYSYWPYDVEDDRNPADVKML